MAGAELQDVARLRAAKVIVELGHDRRAADLVEVVGRVEARKRLAVARPDDVDGHLIGVDRGAIDGLELGELVAHPLDLRIDLFVARSRPRDLDAQAAVAGDADLRSHLDDRVERDRTLLAARRDVDLGRRDDIDVVLAHRLRVVLGKRLAKCLFAGHRGADARFEDASGRLARPEPGDAHLVSDATERCIHRFVEFRLVDLDRNLDLVVFEGLDGALHRPGSIPVGWSRPARPHRSFDRAV